MLLKYVPSDDLAEVIVLTDAINPNTNTIRARSDTVELSNRPA